MSNANQGYLTKAAAAAYLSLSPRTLDYLVARGELPAFKPILNGARHRKVLFCKDDLEKWMQKHRAAVDLDKLVNETVREVLGK